MTDVLRQPADNQAEVARAFPPGFLWGSATAAHQVEGNNANNDWWAAEQAGKVPFKSGLACDQYNRYDDDFALFGGELLSPTAYVIDTAVLAGIALFAHRLARARKMVAQYPWLYERAGLLDWRDKSR